MADAAPAAAGAPAAGGQRNQQGGLGAIANRILRMGLMWYVMKQFTGGGKKPAVGPGSPAVAGLTPLLPKGTPMDVHFFISEDASWNAAAKADPVWLAQSVAMGASEPLMFPYLYRPSKGVQNNGTVYVHTVFTPPGASPDPDADDFDSALSFGKTRQLIAYLPKPKAEDGVNLLTGKNSTDDKALPEGTAASNETVIASYLKPNVTITMIDDYK